MEFQLIVLDDGSVDATAALARKRGVEVVDVPATPPGWAPKNWALHHGLELLERADRSPEVVVFLDADVRPSPGLIGDLARRADATDGLVSIQPFHHTDTAVEQLSAPFNLVSMMGVGTAAHPAAHLATRGAFGPVLATRLDAYHQIGGHLSVRSDIVEDMALAARFRAEGRTVEVFGGHDRVSFRMFPLGLRQLVEGWSKNMASGSGRIPLWRTLALVGWVAAASSVAIEAIGSGLTGRLDAWMLLAAGFVAQFHHHHRQPGNFRWWTAPAYPLLLATFMGLFFYSAYRTHLRRSVVWRGRTLRLDRPADRGVTRLHPWENRSFYRDRLRIKRWKDRLPEAGGLFEGGFAKRQIENRSEHHLARWLAETRRAEYTHWLNIAAVPLFFVLFPPPLAAVHLCFALAVHLPFVAIQRYNRLRLQSAAGRIPVAAHPASAQSTSKVWATVRSGSTRPATPRQA